MDVKEAGKIGHDVVFAKYGREMYVRAGRAKKGKKSPGSGRFGKRDTAT